MDGLVWSEGCKLADVAFGIKKLVISAIIEDEKVGIADVEDPILAMEDLVQSVRALARLGVAVSMLGCNTVTRLRAADDCWQSVTCLSSYIAA
eukprot:14298-Heterococcus_DN1.PRE.1